MNEMLRRLRVPLRVVLDPNPKSALSGEVNSNTIYIYECDPQKIRETFLHEVVDFYVSRAVEPYKNLLNTMVRAVNDDVYKRKEEAAEALRRIAEELVHESET